MSEQQVGVLIAALKEQTIAQEEQTVATNRLAEPNNALRDVIIQSLTASGDIETTTLGDERFVYLSQETRG